MKDETKKQLDELVLEMENATTPEQKMTGASVSKNVVGRLPKFLEGDELKEWQKKFVDYGKKFAEETKLDWDTLTGNSKLDIAIASGQARFATEEETEKIRAEMIIKREKKIEKAYEKRFGKETEGMDILDISF
jgi:hypothetical protein